MGDPGPAEPRDHDFYWSPEGNLAAIVLRNTRREPGIQFVTPWDTALQLGVMRRLGGYTVEPHVHVVQHREIDQTNEVLFVRTGRVQITLYNSCQTEYAAFEVTSNDVVLLGGGGHGVTFLEDSEIVEVKQGPFSPDEDKTRFTPK